MVVVGYLDLAVMTPFAFLGVCDGAAFMIHLKACATVCFVTLRNAALAPSASRKQPQAQSSKHATSPENTVPFFDLCC